MRILAVSDIHGACEKVWQILRRERDADLVIIAGDLTTFGTPEEARAALEGFGTHGIPLLVVAGNMDPPPLEDTFAQLGIGIDGRAYEIPLRDWSSDVCSSDLLTHLEGYFRSLHDALSAYSTSFIARGVEKFVYPDIPENLLRGGEILLTVLYLVVYGYWAKKLGLWRRLIKLFHGTAS